VSGVVTVATPNGSAISAMSFTVLGAAAGPPTITSFTPAIWLGTGSLTINGTNFDTTPANDRVTMNVGLATPTAATATSLSVPVVSAATSGRLVVATVAGTAVSANDFFVPPSGYSGANAESTGRMTVGGSAPLSFGTGGKFSLRLFDSTQGHRVAAKIDSVTFASGTVKIYDPWGQIPVGGSADLFANFTRFVEPVAIESAGSYTVLVAPGATYTGSATITLYDVPDDVTGSIVPGGASVPVSIGAVGQNARLTFSGTSGHRVSVQATDTSIAVGGLSVVNPDGTTLGGVNAIASLFANSTTFREVVALPSTGTYTVLVDPSAANTGGTTVTLYDVPADDAGTLTVNGSSSTVSIGTPGQNGVRTFTANPSQQVTVRVTSNAIGSVTVKLLSFDGTTELATASTGATNFDLQTVTLPSNAPPNGTYTITINPYYWATGTLNVSVSNP